MKYSPSTQRIWCLFLCTALILCCPYTVLADSGRRDADAPAVLGASLGLSGECGTAEQLIELLNDGATEITLTDNIVFVGSVQTSRASASATIVMGEYSITVEPGAQLTINRPVQFEGVGSTAPLLNLGAGSYLEFTSCNVVATGDGATGVYIGDLAALYGLRSVTADGASSTAVEAYSTLQYSSLSNITLSAAGQNGTALRTGSRIDLSYATVTSGGTALVIGGDLQLKYCEVRSEGDAAEVAGRIDMLFSEVNGDLYAGGNIYAQLSDVTGAVAAGGEIRFESCYAEPVPENAVILEKEAAWRQGDYILTDYGYGVTPGEHPNLPDTLRLALWTQGDEFLYLTVGVEWDDSGVDTAEPGTTWAKIVSADFPRYLGGIDYLVPGKIPIHTYDPNKPFLSYAFTHDILGLYIYFAQDYREAEEIILWTSEDDGETWIAYSSDSYNPGLEYTPSMGRFCLSPFFGLTDDTAYLFQIEVIGGGVTGQSNILRHWYSLSGTPDPMTGDREGDGRDDGEDPGGTEPPDPGNGGDGGTDETGNPPPSPPPTDGGGDGNGDNGNSPGGGNGEEPPGGDGGGEGSTGNGDDGKPTGAGSTDGDSSGSSTRSSGGGTGSGRQDSAAAAGNTTAAGQVPTSTETPSNSAQPSESAQPVISPMSAAPSPAYPEGASVYTAAELAALALANPERIAFLEGNLRAVLPTSDLLEAVGGGSFAILLEQSGGNGFHIRLYAEGQELESLGGAVFQVSLPLPDGDENPLCTDDGGGEILARVENGRIVCDLTRTGRYEITGEPTAAVTAAGSDPVLESGSPQPALESDEQGASSGTQAVWWIALSCLAVCAAAFVFLRRRVRFG